MTWPFPTVLDNLVPCEYCGEDGHFVADCPDLADWDKRQRELDAAEEWAYWQHPGWKAVFGE